MWRVLAGTLLGASLVIGLNAILLLFTPVRGFPLQASDFGMVHAISYVLALLVWSVGVFGGAVLACRFAGRLEAVVSIGSAVLGTAALAGFLPAFSNSIAAADLQLGSIMMSLPLLFLIFSGGLVAFFARRPDIV